MSESIRWDIVAGAHSNFCQFPCAIVVGALLIGDPVSVQAQIRSGGCQTGRFNFNFANEVIDTVQTVAARSCQTGFSGGTYVTFTELRFVQRPAHMSVEPLSNGFAWRVSPRGGYTGPDSYTVRICGTFRNTTGCSTIRYTVTIR